jgi:hypothetical protein
VTFVYGLAAADSDVLALNKGATTGCTPLVRAGIAIALWPLPNLCVMEEKAQTKSDVAGAAWTPSVWLRALNPG